MILAYHRVSSNAVLDRILESGEIIPAAYRLDPDRLRDLCNELVTDTTTPGAAGVMTLVDEAAAYFESVQGDRPKTRDTALKCEDVLSGDAGRIFLSPGTWSEAGRALGWPLSGFAFDAENLLEKGAKFRSYDLGPGYWVLLREVMEESRTPEEAKERLIDGLKTIHSRQMEGEEAIEAIQVFSLRPGEESWPPDERKKYEWPRGTEIVWDGPLPVDWAIEIRRNDQLIEV